MGGEGEGGARERGRGVREGGGRGGFPFNYDESFKVRGGWRGELEGGQGEGEGRGEGGLGRGREMGGGMGREMGGD